jgi:hypothetical protein
MAATNDGLVYKGKGMPSNPKLVQALTKHAGANAINIAALHAASVTQSESSRVNGSLVEDMAVVLNGNCVCLNNFLCTRSDRSLFEALKADLVAYSGESLKTTGATDAEQPSASSKDTTASSRGLMDWSKHEVYENPTSISATFNAIIEALDVYFDVEVYATRLNYYRDGSTWKPFHQDSHAYGGKALREDFTVGLSLGETRHLEFLHEPSGKMFSFPQDNGDCFAFTSEVNSRFKHGIPKSKNPECGDRFSIIVWGRRRTINERNGGGANARRDAPDAKPVNTVDDAVEAAYGMVNRMGSRQQSTASGEEEVANGKPAKPAADKKKKNRLQ